MKTAFIISGESLNSRLYSFSEEKRKLNILTSVLHRNARNARQRRSHSCPVLSDVLFSEPFSPFPLPWLIHFPTVNQQIGASERTRDTGRCMVTSRTRGQTQRSSGLGLKHRSDTFASSLPTSCCLRSLIPPDNKSLFTGRVCVRGGARSTTDSEKTLNQLDKKTAGKANRHERSQNRRLKVWTLYIKDTFWRIK